MNPPVIVGDAATRVLLVVVEVRRQDHRFGWLRWWLVASHADSVAGVSSVPAGVADRPPNEQPPGHVKKRQAASLGLLSEPANDGVDIGLAPLDALAIHLGGAGVAGAVRRGGDPDTGEQLF
jgi:hypothetical protein